MEKQQKTMSPKTLFTCRCAVVVTGRAVVKTDRAVVMTGHDLSLQQIPEIILTIWVNDLVDG
jgi:hypothetical protein